MNNLKKYTLLLTDPDGIPVEYSGNQIRELQENGQLTLFPFQGQKHFCKRSCQSRHREEPIRIGSTP